MDFDLAYNHHIVRAQLDGFRPLPRLMFRVIAMQSQM